MAKHLARGEGSSTSDHRDYRVVTAALQTLEQQFFRDAAKLFDEGNDCWRGFPKDCRNAKFSALVFRLLSRMCCCVEEMLALPHSQHPHKIFWLLADPELAEVFLTAYLEKPCELDEFSKQFIEHFRDVGLASTDALVTLRALAITLRVDIAEIE